MRMISFIQVNSFLNYIFSVLEFFGDLRAEILARNFLREIRLYLVSISEDVMNLIHYWVM